MLWFGEGLGNRETTCRSKSTRRGRDEQRLDRLAALSQVCEALLHQSGSREG